MVAETIAAIATAYGAAGIGIVRISGEEAAEIAERVFKSKSGKKIKDLPTYQAVYGHIFDEANNLIDEAIALVMWAPHSFTGENVVELQCHGGAIILKKILELVLRAGARLAKPGEFSQRAFLNGRLDLSQAEAILELINAKTELAANVAVNQLEGSLSQKIKQGRQIILELIANLEVELDYPEEELELLNQQEKIQSIKDVLRIIENLLATFKQGRILREGLKAALIGQPNVGKSSLLNTLLKTKRAIVTDIPGTTRDIIEEYYNLGGLPLILIDTAGIRKTTDPVEKLGVRKAQEIMEQADLIIYLLDLKVGLTAFDEEILKQFSPEKILLVGNKVDLVSEGAAKIMNVIQEKFSTYRCVLISATEQIGIKELEAEIKNFLFKESGEFDSTVCLTNLRHKTALVKAQYALKQALQAVISGVPADLILIDLKDGLDFLGEITGEKVAEEIIDQIFARFCLGK
ncbi:MAG TPA: tRNA uridine-5-carboxymethylaminomethyl(34) synthesis GTPase MnmE [Clostridia bacterium]|nr:tRNA uridine-5-carboxymethylaminomethyl(34) synthesis GTPase MnmE [Clostridia bacterium]